MAKRLKKEKKEPELKAPSAAIAETDLHETVPSNVPSEGVSATS